MGEFVLDRKRRVPIKSEIVADVMFAADRTCCICRIRGRPVQIHHVVSLATYYPEEHFDRENPRDYFSELIASRFRWHRYHIETVGQGRGGTIVGPMVVGAVIEDLEQMVVDMVMSLLLDWKASTDVELECWKEEWQRSPGGMLDDD